MTNVNFAEIEFEENRLRAMLAARTEERDAATSARKHTWKWSETHYGKVHDWARKTLPEPYISEYFGCLANGLARWDEHGKSYMCKAGFEITPGAYFTMGAQEQLLFDQYDRAEKAEQERDGLLAWVDMQDHANQCSSLAGGKCDCWKARMTPEKYLTAVKARAKAEGRQSLAEDFRTANPNELFFNLELARLAVQPEGRASK